MSASNRGELRETPLPELLTASLDEKRTGTTVLLGPDTIRHVICFRDGIPTKTRSSIEVAPLDSTLLDLGVLDSDTLRHSLAAVRQSGVLHGQWLLSQGLIDEQTLQTALSEQLTRKLSEMALLPPETSFSHFEGANLLAEYGGADAIWCDPLAIIMAVSRAAADTLPITARLAGIADLKLTLHSDANPNRLALGDQESPVVELLTLEPMSLAEVVECDVVPEPVARLTLYVLLLTRFVSPFDATRAAQPLDTDRFSEADVRQRLEAVRKQSLFDVLGIGRDASRDDVQRAFLRLAWRWRPDRLAHRHRSLRDDVAGVWAKLVEARETLGDPLRRATYASSVGTADEPSTASRALARAVQSAVLFHDAELLVQRESFVEAERLVKQALEVDPERPEYKALLAWIYAQYVGPASTRGAEDRSPYHRQIRMLDEVLAVDPHYERALFYRAQLWKRSGDEESAMSDFRRVLEVNPGNLDAKREVRLHDMRARHKEQPQPGLLRRWFTRSSGR